jgi:hypothetical protein
MRNVTLSCLLGLDFILPGYLDIVYFILQVAKEKGFGNKEKKNNNAAKRGKFERGRGGRGGAFSP